MKNFKQECLMLLDKRGLISRKHVTVDAFRKDFVAHVHYGALDLGKGDNYITELLSLMGDDSILVNPSKISDNFRMSFDEFIPDLLMNNKLFQYLYPIILKAKGKGVGEGELLMPFIIKGYRFTNQNDGECDGKRIEMKKEGASLKAAKWDATKKGVVDELNNKFFNGSPPGRKSDKLFAEHIKEAEKNPEAYEEYFQALYPGVDKRDMKRFTEYMKNNYHNKHGVINAIGKLVLKEYQKIDKWDTIIMIDSERKIIVGINDVNNIESLGLKFTPKLARGGDTQAIADGYVNMSIRG